MGFSLDFNDTFEGGVQNGTYEVVVDKVLPKTTSGGTEYVNFDLIIRNDFDQKFKNAHIFHSVWKAKDTGKYNMKSFNTIGKACKLQNGKSYKSFEELLQDFEKKVCRVTVKNETSEYGGKTYENLNVKSWAESTVPACRHQFKAKDDMTVSDMFNNNGSIDITDDDLPF
jgi:hypothetical protein